MKFGDEIEPVEFFANNKNYCFIFMSWMGGDLSDYARVAVIVNNREFFDEQGVWIKGFGLVLLHDGFFHKSKIKKMNLVKKIFRRLKWLISFNS